MKNFFKKFILFCGIIATVSGTVSFVASTPIFAEGETRSDGGECKPFLGMTPWDCGVTDMNSETDLQNNIVKIASNVLIDISVLSSYLVIGYVIWGGYLYMFSSGDPGKAAAGKKTLIHAFIGLAITISAYTIFNAIRIALIGSSKNFGDCSSLTNGCVDGGTLVVNLINWVTTVSGIVAAIFIVVGAWGYITASGDPGKLQKAKTTIIYALIGLAIVALAKVITAFVSSTIRDANASVSTSEIANNYKELPNHEKV